MPIAITNIIPASIFADLAQYDSIKTGQNRAGMFFAARNFANKMCQSIVVIACSLLLGMGADGTGAATSKGVRNTALVAMIFVAVSVIVYVFYNDKEISAAIKAHNEAQEKRAKSLISAQSKQTNIKSTASDMGAVIFSRLLILALYTIWQHQKSACYSILPFRFDKLRLFRKYHIFRRSDQDCRH